MNDKHVVFVIVGIVVLVTLGMFFRGAISDFKGEEKEENYRRVIAWSEYGDTTSITLLAGQRAELYKPAGYCVKYTGKHELKIVEVNVIESHFTVEALKTYRFDFTKIPYDTCFKILDDLIDQGASPGNRLLLVWRLHNTLRNTLQALDAEI